MSLQRGVHKALAFALAVTVAGAGFVPAAQADISEWRQFKKPERQPAKKQAKDEGSFKPWAEVTKDAKEVDGFFKVYEKPNAVYFALAPDQLDMEFLGVETLAGGIGDHFPLLGGLPLNDRLLMFRRVDNKVLLVQKNELFVAPKGSPIEKAIELSHGHSVLAMLDIMSEHPESKSLLVDMTSVVVSDVSDMSEAASRSLDNKPVAFDPSRSTLTMVKNFPRNTEIEAQLTFSPSRDSGDFLTFGLNPMLYSVPDQRYIPLKVRYSFVQLPEEPMKPRLADSRVGYFLTVKKDFSRDTQEDFFVRYVNRWRLEKRDPDAALSEPVKPIVYWIDRTVPTEYHDWIKVGIEKWQKAFEAAGFKNAIIAKVAPTEEEDPDWSAEDARYSTIRWITSAGNSFNGIGPSRVDPRTGEILDADILIEAQAMTGYRTSWRKYAGPSAMVADILPEIPYDEFGIDPDYLCMDQSTAALDGGLMRATLAMDGSMPPGSPVPDEYLKPYVERLIMHEVGHTLGLRHNFRSSSATPFEKLHDVPWTSSRGLMGSVMDYVIANINPDRSKQGEYYITTPGTYDLFAIRYGYTPSGTGDMDSDYAFAETIADESAEAGHEYGTDADAGAVNALDPSTNRWDLSADPLAWSKQRSDYLEGLWKSEGFEDRILGEGTEFAVMSRAMNTLLILYGRTCAYATKYFGGQHVVRDHAGQPGGRVPLTPIPAEKQREAMDFLANSIFSQDAFEVAPGRLRRLAIDRWEHWGNSNTGPTSRIDYSLANVTLVMQTFVLNRMLNPMQLARVDEAENRTSDPYSLAEYMGGMTGAIWGEVDGAFGPGLQKLEEPTSRRDLQRLYVDLLARIMVDPFPGTPDNARAMARLELTRIDDRARRALGLSGIGDYTRSHLMETRARIERALDAEATIES